MAEPFPDHETNQTPPSGIMPNQMPADMMPGVEAHIAASLGADRAIVSPGTWMVDPEQAPDIAFDAAIALGGISKIANGLIKINPLHEGVATALFGDPERPNAMAFVSGNLSRRELEAVRTDVVGEVNGVLASVQSPHRL